MPEIMENRHSQVNQATVLAKLVGFHMVGGSTLTVSSVRLSPARRPAWVYASTHGCMFVYLAVCIIVCLAVRRYHIVLGSKP